MIQVKNIDGNPESKPEMNFGSKSDEKFFYFYESKDEAEANRYVIAPQIPKYNDDDSELIRLFKSATPEEIEVIKTLLK